MQCNADLTRGPPADLPALPFPSTSMICFETRKLHVGGWYLSYLPYSWWTLLIAFVSRILAYWYKPILRINWNFRGELCSCLLDFRVCLVWDKKIRERNSITSISYTSQTIYNLVSIAVIRVVTRYLII